MIAIAEETTAVLTTERLFFWPTANCRQACGRWLPDSYVGFW